MWKECVALKHHPDATLLGWNKFSSSGESIAIAHYLAVVRLLKACDYAKSGRLSTPGRPQQCEDLSPLNVERQILDYVLLACVEGLAKISDAEE